jgi:hypothetical protein
VVLVAAPLFVEFRLLERVRTSGAGGR